jgi:hypothetical protein
MSISSLPHVPAASSSAEAEAERSTVVLKKQQDIARQPALTVVDLIRQAPAPAPSGRIDVYG